MSQIPSSFARSTSLLSSNQLMRQLRQTQNELVKAQLAISTGKQINKPSDAPAKTSAILLVNQQLDARDQQDRNLDHVVSMLNNVDQAIGDVNALAIEAKTLGLSQIGITSNAQTRQAEAAVVDGQISALMDIVNRRIQGVGLFTGNANAAQAENRAFDFFLGGIRYLGSTTNLVAQTGLTQPVAFNSNGADALNALSGRVQGSVDLNPNATPATPLRDLNGVLGLGIRQGSVQLTLDGTAVTVDLSTAQTMGDVVTRIQNAIDTTNPAAGNLAVTASGFQLTANAGHTLSITDLPGGITGADLGLNITATSGQSVTGADPGVKLSMLTSVADLGASIDLTSGLKITQAQTTKIADFSNATTIQDMANVIDGLHLGLRLEINEQGTGLNLISQVSGIDLTVGENAGGTTASDLGLRTFGLSTQLTDFNHGIGVDRQTGKDDLRLNLHNGNSIDVNLDAATTVSDVINALQAAATAAGLNVGNPGDLTTDLNLGLASDGNGLILEDNTTGASDFEVVSLNASQAAGDLGILMNVGTGNQIQGTDNAPVQVDSFFTHLINLKESLLKNDSRGISLATDNIDKDTQLITQARAEIGVRTQRVERAQQRSTELRISEQSLLNQLQGGDLTELILNFQQLQQQLQASLSVGAQNLQQSLLNFLR